MYFNKKIKTKVRSNPEHNATPSERIKHLSHKARHYEREAEKYSKGIYRIKNWLTFGTFLSTLAMLTLFVLYQEKFIDSSILSLSLIFLGLLAGLITLALQFLVNEKKARKLIQIATLFSEIKMECNHVVAIIGGQDTEANNKMVIGEYLRLSKKYEKLKAKYIKHRKRYSSYYRFIGGAGMISVDE